MSANSTPTTPVTPGRRDPAKEQFWRDTLADFDRAGVSVREYCRTHGLSEKRFFTWRRTLRDRDAGPTPVPAGPAFVPVRITADPVIEVVVRPGLTVRVPVHADPAAAARLVAALAGVGPC